ncbi:hypothetical protein NJB1604_44690 [Mycobacterium marinum]|uniref:DUF6315 family protein n=1 Tax=Mycobacterium marinum TaxID=1781 RepID=UPI0021C38A08|nr:DUF6315 family protein [Mycobacterium marinum]GJO53979.1 hypothetical protein NJB1604_44690 [Mycobacterium marinum]
MKHQRQLALCCVCGQQRTVSERYGVLSDANHSSDRGDSEKFGWRMTVTLKCSHCRALTRHARLRSDDDPYKDHAEQCMYQAAAANRADKRLIDQLRRELLDRLQANPPSTWPPELLRAVATVMDAAGLGRNT